MYRNVVTETAIPKSPVPVYLISKTPLQLCKELENFSVT